MHYIGTHGFHYGMCKTMAEIPLTKTIDTRQTNDVETDELNLGRLPRDFFDSTPYEWSKTLGYRPALTGACQLPGTV